MISLLKAVTLHPVYPSGPGEARLSIVVDPLPSGFLLTVRGDLDHHTLHLLARDLPDLSTVTDPVVILDLSALQFCDSTGLAGLYRLWQQVTETGGALALAGVHGVLLRMLTTTRLDQILPMYATTADAREALGR